MAPGPIQRTDRSLLLEVGLIITLATLAILLYWRPAARDELSPAWWHGVVLGALFFAIVALHSWRSRRRSQRALHETIREEAATASERDAARPADELEAGASTRAEAAEMPRDTGEATSGRDRGEGTE